MQDAIAAKVKRHAGPVVRAEELPRYIALRYERRGGCLRFDERRSGTQNDCIENKQNHVVGYRMIILIHGWLILFLMNQISS